MGVDLSDTKEENAAEIDQAPVTVTLYLSCQSTNHIIMSTRKIIMAITHVFTPITCIIMAINRMSYANGI